MEKGTQAMVVGCCLTRDTRELIIHMPFSQQISQEAKAKRLKTSAVKGRLIIRENPTMCCQKPGCEKTFLKYYIDKRRGRTHWNQPRKYCHEHHMSGQIQ